MLIDEARIKMPKWHEDARRMREQGMKVVQITSILEESGIKVTAARVSQVTHPRWEEKAEYDRIRHRKGGISYENKLAKRHKQKEEPMDRTFDKVSSSDPTDVYHRVRIKCTHDNCQATLIFSRRGSINNHQAAQWFRDKGWGVGGGPRADLCPDHFKRLNGSSKPTITIEHPGVPDPHIIPIYVPDDLALPSKQVAAAIDPPPAPTPPTDLIDQMSAMTRTDRRLINAKLNDVYIDEERGYRADWSDAKVAEDLGASILWVAAIREENFGPDINEIDAGQEKMIMEKMNELAAITAEVQQAIKEYDAKVDEIDIKIEAFDKHRAEVTSLLIDYHKAKEHKHG